MLMGKKGIQSLIRQSVDLAEGEGRIIVATASEQGVPHTATGANMSMLSGARIRLRYWFCPNTIANVARNRWMSVVVWDPVHDRGYQLVGTVEQIAESAIADGYIPLEEQPSVPQVERELVLSVQRVLEFREAPHNDRELTQ
jgi:hypothetical protein